MSILDNLIKFLIILICSLNSTISLLIKSKIIGSHIVPLKQPYHISYALYSLSNAITDGFQCFSHIEFDASKYLLSGAIAGGCRSLSRSITFPLDTIKTFQQSYTTIQPQNHSNLAINQEINYFRGILISTLSAIPANAIFFLIYNYLEQYYPCIEQSILAIHNDDKILQTISLTTLLRRILFSSIATVPQNLIKSPAELIKQRAQLSPNSISIIDIIYNATNDQNIGWKGLFIGCNAQLIREIPYNAFQMAFYDMFKEYSVSLGYLVLSDSNSPRTLSYIGAFSAFLSALLTQPADVIKTKLMTGNKFSKSTVLDKDIILDIYTNPTNSTSVVDNTTYIDTNTQFMNIRSKDQTNRYTTTTTTTNNNNNNQLTLFEVISDIWSNEGIYGFYRGLLPRLLIVTLGGLVYFYAAEIILEH